MKPEEFDQVLGKLIDKWCERKELSILRVILPAYPRVSGLTDEWDEILTALKAIRVRHEVSLANGEMDSLVELIHIAEAVVYR